MAAYGNVTIGTTAALITAQDGGRKSVLVENAHASNVLYVGNDSSVTTSNGFKIAAGASQRFYEPGPLYGIASAASTDVRYYKEGFQG